MNNLKKIILVGFISSLASVMVACGDNPDETTSKDNAKGDHVWKTQTDTLQSAKDMAKKMQESLNQQQETMDENN